jgi:hypothetical protein
MELVLRFESPAHCSFWHMSEMVSWTQNNHTNSLNCEIKVVLVMNFEMSLHARQIGYGDMKLILFACQCCDND